MSVGRGKEREPTEPKGNDHDRERRDDHRRDRDRGDRRTRILRQVRVGPACHARRAGRTCADSSRSACGGGGSTLRAEASMIKQRLALTLTVAGALGGLAGAWLVGPWCLGLI